MYKYRESVIMVRNCIDLSTDNEDKCELFTVGIEPEPSAYISLMIDKDLVSATLMTICSCIEVLEDDNM